MRGQAHTLEGIIGALILVSSLVFAMQVTAVTPLSASTSSQHIENQQQAVAEGVLAVADSNGTLTTATLYWDESENTFHGLGGEEFYTNDDEVDSFTLGELLNESFGSRGVAFNVNLIYQTSSGDRRSRWMVYRGAPSDNAVTTIRSVTLYDDDRLRESDGSNSSTTVKSAASSGGFYARDASPGSSLFNVIRVEVTVWRM
jgi:hypothetical protein